MSLQDRVRELRDELRDGGILISGNDAMTTQAMRTYLVEKLDVLLAQSEEPGKFEQPEGTWCPECGPGVRVDEEGLCVSCGATAIGNGANAALRALAARPAEEGLREALRMDKPWPISEVLRMLCYFAETMLNERGYDGHDHESLKAAAEAGREIDAALTRGKP